MRIYLPVDIDELELLNQDSAIEATRFVPEDEDEESEFSAYSAAAAEGRVVVSADVPSLDAPVTLAEVAAFHVDLDGSGGLAWFATQEIGAVLAALRAAAPIDPNSIS